MSLEVGTQSRPTPTYSRQLDNKQTNADRFKSGDYVCLTMFLLA